MVVLTNVFPPPRKFAPFGEFCAITELTTVVLSVASIPPPPVELPTTFPRKTQPLTCMLPTDAAERPAPAVEAAFPWNVQFVNEGLPAAIRTPPPRLPAEMPEQIPPTNEAPRRATEAPP